MAFVITYFMEGLKGCLFLIWRCKTRKQYSSPFKGNEIHVMIINVDATSEVFVLNNVDRNSLLEEIYI